MEITVITPPDRLYDDSIKILLIYPNDQLKNLLSEYLKTINTNITVYLYEEVEHDEKWLLSCIDQSNLIFYDLNNATSQVRSIDGYILTKSNTYWLTSGENPFYNLISKKRIFNYNQFIDKIGGLIG